MDETDFIKFLPDSFLKEVILYIPNNNIANVSNESKIRYNKFFDDQLFSKNKLFYDYGIMYNGKDENLIDYRRIYRNISKFKNISLTSDENIKKIINNAFTNALEINDKEIIKVLISDYRIEPFKGKTLSLIYYLDEERILFLDVGAMIHTIFSIETGHISIYTEEEYPEDGESILSIIRRSMDASRYIYQGKDYNVDDWIPYDFGATDDTFILKSVKKSVSPENLKNIVDEISSGDIQEYAVFYDIFTYIHMLENLYYGISKDLVKYHIKNIINEMNDELIENYSQIHNQIYENGIMDNENSLEFILRIVDEVIH